MILEQKVKIKWSINNKKYYESLEYTYTKIGEYFEVDVHDLAKGSDSKVKYLCDYCNGENQIEEKSKYKRYRDYIRYRKITGKDCCNHKECKSKKSSEAQLIANTPNGNSLADMFPDVAKEWNCYKNDKTPHDYTMKSNKIVWWFCSKGHEYDTTIYNRTHVGINCPYCSNKKVLVGFNDLLTTHPELAAEWNYSRNEDIFPHDIVAGSNQKVWWNCEEGHEWETTPNHRTSGGTGCPACSESKGEKRIRKWLERNSHYKFEAQKEFNGLLGLGGKPLSYDFYLPECNLLIEFQGEFHDGKANKYVKENLEIQQEHDGRKKRYAEINNINLLEIWYWDFDKVEEILENKLIYK